MKMMQGAFFLACSNMSRTRLAPTPTNISTKSEPEMVKKGTLASPAIARASSVLPVPGGPTRRTPRGMRPPRRWNFCGSRRNSTISSRSCLHLAHEEQPDTEDEEHGQQRAEIAEEAGRTIGLRTAGDRDVLRLQAI